jgi:hypothetical protein
MRVRGLIATLVVASAVVTGCGSGIDQPSGGEGWTLGRVVYPSQRPLGVNIAMAGAESYGLEITVAGPGGGNCGVPILTGFQRVSNVLLARVKRTSADAQCHSTTSITWSVLVSRAWLPPDLTEVAVEESCSQPGCMGLGVVLPNQLTP